MHNLLKMAETPSTWFTTHICPQAKAMKSPTHLRNIPSSTIVLYYMKKITHVELQTILSRFSNYRFWWIFTIILLILWSSNQIHKSQSLVGSVNIKTFGSSKRVHNSYICELKDMAIETDCCCKCLGFIRVSPWRTYIFLTPDYKLKGNHNGKVF